MSARHNDLVQFLARYAVYLVLPGLWLAYVGGMAPWAGGTAGFLCALALGLGVLGWRRLRPRRPRNRLEDLLAD